MQDIVCFLSLTHVYMANIKFDGVNDQCYVINFNIGANRLAIKLKVSLSWLSYDISILKQ